MRLTQAKIHPRLLPWIDSIWVFESDVGVPETSSRVIAPNGKAKLILSYRNSLHVEHARGFQTGREGGLHFIGVWDESAVISSPLEATGTIGIEFKHEGVRPHRGVRDARDRQPGVRCGGDLRKGREGSGVTALTSSVGWGLEHLQAFLIERMSRTLSVAPIQPRKESFQVSQDLFVPLPALRHPDRPGWPRLQLRRRGTDPRGVGRFGHRSAHRPPDRRRLAFRGRRHGGAGCFGRGRLDEGQVRTKNGQDGSCRHRAVLRGLWNRVSSLDARTVLDDFCRVRSAGGARLGGRKE